jgi:GDP-L-fucose synthase
MTKVLVTGGYGFLGQHIVQELMARNYDVEIAPRSSECDLRDSSAVNGLLASSRPDIVIHAAAHCGGIGLNKEKPAELFYDNIMMGVQLMHKAWKYQVNKFVQIGTICEYPNIVEVPFREETIWDGYPETTNAAYGIAKKALLVQGQAYRQQYDFDVIHLLPVNLYGPRDNFDPESSHVIPALIRKIAEAFKADAPSVDVWGTGRASREFLYVADAAEAIVSAMESYSEAAPVNIGSGVEITIAKLVEMIADAIGYRGLVMFDGNKPDGQPRRCLDTQRAKTKFGFEARTSLEEGLQKTIKWYYEEIA